MRAAILATSCALTLGAAPTLGLAAVGAQPAEAQPETANPAAVASEAAEELQCRTIRATAPCARPIAGAVTARKRAGSTRQASAAA